MKLSKKDKCILFLEERVAPVILIGFLILILILSIRGYSREKAEAEHATEPTIVSYSSYTRTRR